MTETSTQQPLSHQQQCPLCGKNNHCAMTEGSAIEDCWCHSTPVSKQALAKLDNADIDKRCLCPQCAQQADISS